MDDNMDDNIAIWTITWTRKNRGRWSEEILFIFPENFTHPHYSQDQGEVHSCQDPGRFTLAKIQVGPLLPSSRYS